MTTRDLLLRWVQDHADADIVDALVLPRAQQLVILRAYRDDLVAQLQPRLNTWDADKAAEKAALTQQIADLNAAI